MAHTLLIEVCKSISVMILRPLPHRLQLRVLQVACVPLYAPFVSEDDFCAWGNQYNVLFCSHIILPGSEV